MWNDNTDAGTDVLFMMSSIFVVPAFFVLLTSTVPGTRRTCPSKDILVKLLIIIPL